MPIVSRVAAMTSKAWGQFKSGVAGLAGNYLYLWGLNTSGQIGNGMLNTAATARSSPVQVAIRKNFVSLSVGSNMMAISSTGQLWGFGANSQGSLGDGTSVAKSSPVQIGTLTDWALVSAKANLTGAIKTDGSLWMWGTAAGGGLGNGTTTPAISSPVQIGTLTNWSKLAVGVSSCSAIKTDGTLWSWGLGTSGQFGDGTTVAKSSPVQIGTLTNWSQITAGTQIRHAIKTDGTLWAWGVNSSGALGDGTSVNKSSPVQIGTLTTWSKVSSGLSSMMAIKTDGTLWGSGSAITLGLGGNLSNIASQIYVSSPAQIAYNYETPTTRGLPGRTYHAINYLSGQLFGWGYNASGELGNSTTSPSSNPVAISSSINTWAQVSDGINSFAAITQAGALWVCGSGNSGQLGDGTITAKSSPVQLGTLTNWAMVACGEDYMSAIKTDGTLWAWGINSSGQLGDGTTTIRSSPVQIGTLTNWSKVSLGGLTSYAVKTDGTLWAWGGNSNGSVGNGSTVNVSSPVQIGTLTNWVDVRSMERTAIAIKSDGTIWSWGENDSGQIGDGTTSNRSSPVQIGTLTTWSSVFTAFRNGYAKKNDNTFWGWGYNGAYNLGDGTSINKSSPVQIGTETDYTYAFGGRDYGNFLLRNTRKNIFGLGNNQNPLSNNEALALWPLNGINYSSPIQISIDNNWSSIQDNQLGDTFVATRTNNTLWAWGKNTNGMIGQGDTVDYYSPVQIGTLTNWSKASIGTTSIAALNANGQTFTIGDSQIIGQSVVGNYSTPVAIGATDKKYAKVSIGVSFAMAIDTSSLLYTWGSNANGQLGLGDTNARSLPTQVGTQTYKSIGQFDDNASYAVRTDGTLWAWGYNLSSYVGNGEITSAVTQLAAPTQVGQLIFSSASVGGTEAGYPSTGASRYIHGISSGALYAIGTNNKGQIGNGTTTNVSGAFVQIGTLTNWSKVVDAVEHTIALKTDGTLWAWGENSSGELGDGTVTDRSSPVQIGTQTNWADIGIGNFASYAVKTDGTLWSWGYGFDGALGNGSTTSRSSPVQIGTLTNWSKVWGASYAGFATKTDGTLWAWGTNGVGQLGDGTTTNRSSPVQIGTLTNWQSVGVTAATSSVTAVKTDGTLWAWGGNQGNLGTNNTTTYSSPVQVGTLTNWTKSITTQNNSYFLNSSQQLFACGVNNDAGTGLYWVGDGTSVNKSSPVQIGLFAEFTDIWGGMAGGFSKSSNGMSFGWGGNGAAPYTYAIVSKTYTSPIQIGTQTNWKTPYIKNDGTLWLWGANNQGQLGIGNIFNDPVTGPVKVGTLTNWQSVTRGSFFAIATKTDGTIWSWGGGIGGVLGIGTTQSRSSPIQIGTLTNWAKVVNGASHAIALKTDGTLWSWGRNNEGQLGDGSTANKSSPVQIGTLTTWTDISASNNCSFGLSSDGALWSWGQGNVGQLGDGTTTNRSSPVQIGTLTSWTTLGSSSIQGNSNVGGAFNSQIL